MKFRKVSEIEEFKKIIDSCEYDVYLKSPYGDVFNLKSARSQYIAFGNLLGEHGDMMELFCENKEDEAKFLHFLSEHPEILD